MWLRRAFYYAQYGAFVVLPVLLLIGRGLVLADNGWDFALLLLVSPILGVFMLVVAGFTVARKSVRRNRALSWLDVAVHFAWYASIIAASVFAHPAIAAVVIVFSVGAFWSALWQLFTETRRRVKSALASLDYTAVPASQYRPASPDAPGAGRVIRLDPPKD
ncbi:MAG TPA: MFS transporter [Homoserinimonas sp.]|nr:MFS transporter [Homoserinimonas sp.]